MVAPRCNVCRRWGHKGQDCSGKEVTILKKKPPAEKETNFAPIPQGAKGAETNGSMMEDLIQNLEALTPLSVSTDPKSNLTNEKVVADAQGCMSGDEAHGIQLTEPVTELFHTSDAEGWQTNHGRKQGPVGGERNTSSLLNKPEEGEEGIVVSPSRFSSLQGIEEEEEEDNDEMEKDYEEGEIYESKAEGKKSQRSLASGRGKRVTATSQKQARGKAVRTKDLLLAGKQGTTKKASGRKI